MIYNNDLLLNLAKRLAMFANDRVSALASAAAIKYGPDYDPSITGAALAMMPHIMEKAIMTNPTLPGDVSLKLSLQFTQEFEIVAKLVCNAGGFTNPIKKAFFNTSFHTMFSRQYKELKPKFDGIWQMAYEQQSDPIDLIGYGLVKYCESSSGLALESDTSIDASCKAMRTLFRDVHGMLQRV